MRKIVVLGDHAAVYNHVLYELAQIAQIGIFPVNRKINKVGVKIPRLHKDMLFIKAQSAGRQLIIGKLPETLQQIEQ